MPNEYLYALRHIVLVGAVVLAASGCEQASQGVPSGGEPSPTNPIGGAADPDMSLAPTAPGDEAGETYPASGDFIPSSTSGLCIAATTVYSESLPDADVSAADLPLSPVLGFTVPTGIATAETRQIFLTAAAFKTFFGVDAPASIDWSTQWVLFYGPGALAHPASQPKVVRVRLRSASLRVTTTTTAPTGTCNGFQPGMPFTLLRFTAPKLPTCRVTYYHRTDSVPCPPVPEPGPSCTGTLTSPGINNLLLTRPKANIDVRSRYSTIKGVSLGDGMMNRWQRTCASPGNCQPWKPLALTLLLDHYGTNIGYYLAYDAPTRITDIYSVSPRYFCDEPGTGWCYASSFVEYDIDRTGSSGAISNYRSDEVIEGRGDRPISDSASDMSSLAAVVNDHCLLLRKTFTKDIGPTAYTETLLKAYLSF